MGQFVRVGTKAEFEDLEAGKLVEGAGQSIAIFSLGGTYYANREHMSASGRTLG